MAAIAQLGENVTVGFNGVTYADFIVDDASEAIIGDIEEIRDADNATETKLISNKGRRYTITGVVKNAGGLDAEIDALRLIEKGSLITVNSVDCMVEECEISFTRTATKATINFIAEDSMIASY